MKSSPQLHALGRSASESHMYSGHSTVTVQCMYGAVAVHVTQDMLAAER